MRMHMSGNQLGKDSLSDTDVIAQDNASGRMPAKLSVVPDDMDMDMLMLGAMYAPSDSITLMAMIMASRKDMNLVSYTPPMMMGADRRLVGGFSTGSGDIEAVALSARANETTSPPKVGPPFSCGAMMASPVAMPMRTPSQP